MIENAFELSPGDVITQRSRGSGKVEFRILVEEVLRETAVLGQMIEMSPVFPQSTRDYYLSSPREILFVGESELCSVTKANYSAEHYIA